MSHAKNLEATQLVEDILLPEAANDEIWNPDEIPSVEQWVLTDDLRAFESHRLSGLPALEAGELFALGLPS